MLPTRRRDLVSRTIDGEVVILDRDGGQVHRLNATASCIWLECDGASTREEIAARVASRFEGVPAHLLDEVTATIDELARLGLLAAGAP